MHKPESVLENEMHIILWIVEIKTDHQNPTRQPDLVLTNKKQRTCLLVDSTVSEDHRVKTKENKK